MSPPDTNHSADGMQSVEFSNLAVEGSAKPDEFVSAAKLSKSELSWRRGEPYSQTKGESPSKCLF